MVLQRNKEIPIWGTAKINEAITVKFIDQTKKAEADSNGIWRVEFSPLSVNKTANILEIQGEEETIRFENILIGDVWLVSGQSNMHQKVRSIKKIPGDILNMSNNSLVRIYNIPDKTSSTPLKTIDTKWEISSEKTIEDFSAIGAIFGLKLQSETNVPIGIINSSLGSTSVSCWLPGEVLEKEPFVKTYSYWTDLADNWDTGGYKQFLEKEIKKYKRKGNGEVPTKENLLHITKSRTYPSGAYNAMLYPIFPFAIRGILWRQGEANVPRGEQYQTLLPRMISYWKSKFNDLSLPFIQIGLPSYGKLNDTRPKVAELRNAQHVIANKNKGIYYVPILDLMDSPNNKARIHPKNKYLAGTRSTRFVMNYFYNSTPVNIIPTYEKIEIKGFKIIISSKNVGNGFFTGRLADLNGDKIEKTNEFVHNFKIADNSKQFVTAKAKIISKNQIEIWSDNIKKPVAVRYAWENVVLKPNLYNSYNIPVSSFRTDDWKLLSTDYYKPKINLVKP